MAHTFDTKARFTGTVDSGKTYLSDSFTCGATATALVVGIVVATTTAREGGAPTYNGVELTRADALRKAAETNCEIWYLLAPATGSAKTVSIPNTGSLTLYVCVSSYISSTGYSAFDGESGSAAVSGSTTPGGTITPTANGDVIVGVCGGGYTSVPTERTHTTLYETDDGNYTDNFQYALIADTTATTVSWTFAVADDTCSALVALKEVASPPTSVTVQPSSKDCLLYEYNKDTVYNGVNITVNPYTSYRQRVLVSFDFSSMVPAGATITKALLRLYDYTVTADRIITVQQLLRGDYVETEATWNIYKTGSSWSTAGCLNSTTDYTATYAATSTSPSGANWQVWDVTNQVQTALDSVAGVAHFLVTDETPNAATKANVYGSNTYADMLCRPKLYIEYSSSFIPKCVFL